MKKYHLILSSLFALLLMVTGCTVGSGIQINSVETNLPGKMAMTYDKFSGYKQRDIKVEQGQALTVLVEVVTEKGSIDAYIAKDNDTADCAYEGHDIPTSSFNVTLSEPGEYTIRVDARDHKGSYSFEWGE